ncbi:hypothetical protein [Methylocystis sp.]|uniref:hypothetical protein n=1 Tax=Methylocystis sp. TaxID=1911079 RepID=UPI003D0ED757
MSAIERNLRQRRDEARRGVARNHEAAHQILRGCIENVDNDEFRRAAPDHAARAKKYQERRPGPGRKGQGVA